ncbi:MAG: FUSC family protein [Proteocatella sp.]
MVQNFSSKVKSNTLMFIVIVIAITLFKSFFGTENALVGVTIIISTLVLSKSDLTQKPIRNLGLLLSMSLFLGILSFFANGNIYLGFLINFIAMLAIGFLLSKNLTKQVIIPYGLQYLFMLYTPVNGEDFFRRMGALVFGAFFILIINYILNLKKEKVQKVIDTDEDCNDDPIKDRESINIRLRYALRLSLTTALAAFLSSYFNLSEGRWMAYTVFSVTELYPEDTNKKIIQRLQGTIIGAVIVVIMFIVFSDINSRMLILILAGYLNSFFDNYKHKMILVTISAVASVALSGGILITAIERVGFVIIGALFAIVGNKIYEKRQFNTL